MTAGATMARGRQPFYDRALDEAVAARLAAERERRARMWAARNGDRTGAGGNPWSRAGLAARLGIGRPALWSRETGGSWPQTLTEWRRWARIVGLDLAELIRGWERERRG